MDAFSSLLDDAKKRVETFSTGATLLDEGGPPMRTKITLKANARAACASRAIALAQLRDARDQLAEVSQAMRAAADDAIVRKCMLSDEIIEFGLLANEYAKAGDAIAKTLDSLDDGDAPAPPTTTAPETDAALIASVRGLADIEDPLKRASTVASTAADAFHAAQHRPPQQQ